MVRQQPGDYGNRTSPALIGSSFHPANSRIWEKPKNSRPRRISDVLRVNCRIPVEIRAGNSIPVVLNILMTFPP